MLRNRMLLGPLVLLLAGMLPSVVRAEERPVKVTVLIRGARSDGDVAALRTALKNVEGIRFKPEAIVKGEKPRFFSKPFVVGIADENKTNVGALASAVSRAQTPSRREQAPALNLVLYTPDPIDEPSVMALRSELMEVNGVEVIVPGGLGGFPRKGYYWIQLEDAGGAALEEILRAVKKAGVKTTLEKPAD